MKPIKEMLRPGQARKLVKLSDSLFKKEVENYEPTDNQEVLEILNFMTDMCKCVQVSPNTKRNKRRLRQLRTTLNRMVREEI